ncbi:MAG TPA: hypothetical protein VKT78_06560 [Fimbriimonadaceae bacterium]|nr:hypothetical protein [Fimbriimonadaceae bacterium]
MKLRLPTWKPVVACAITFALGVGASAQFGGGIRALIKVLGVGAAVTKFGPQINSEVNKIAKTPDTPTWVSKVVPILSGGIDSRKAIGAAQVRGSRKAIDQVKAVAQINQDLLGELKVTVYIPITSKDVIKDLKPVPGAAVTAIVDLRL